MEKFIAHYPALFEILPQWGEAILCNQTELEAACHRAAGQNPWFTPAFSELALKAIARKFLQKDRLTDWLTKYPALTELTPEKSRTVGLVMAGNIPLAGFHDLLSVLIAGHKALVKPSSKDAVLLPWLLALLQEIAPHWQNRIQLVDRLENFDAVIATGGNNTARYFEYYFGKYPHIIRQNRNSTAVLTGTESGEDLQNLGRDVFTYFGLGCRSVSHLFLPSGYKPETILSAFEGFSEIGNHSKYRNNFDYNRSVFLLNRTPHFASDFLILKEDAAFASPIACLHYSFYPSREELEQTLTQRRNSLQCIVGKGPGLVPFGQSQSPDPGDYADNVDTLDFLTALS